MVYLMGVLVGVLLLSVWWVGRNRDRD